MNDWIKTKDDFPDEMRPILFYVYVSYENACFVRYGCWLNGSYESYEENGNRHYDEDKVTHWMYAPTPPNMIMNKVELKCYACGKNQIHSELPVLRSKDAK